MFAWLLVMPVHGNPAMFTAGSSDDPLPIEKSFAYPQYLSEYIPLAAFAVDE